MNKVSAPPSVFLILLYTCVLFHLISSLSIILWTPPKFQLQTSTESRCPPSGFADRALVDFSLTCRNVFTVITSSLRGQETARLWTQPIQASGLPQLLLWKQSKQRSKGNSNHVDGDHCFDFGIYSPLLQTGAPHTSMKKKRSRPAYI